MADEFMNKAKDFVAEKIAHVEKPEADLKDVELKQVSRDSANFNSKLSIHNPYDHTLPICEISYTLKSANRVIASGTMPDPGSIEANQATTLELPMKVPYDILVSLARDIGSDWDIDYELQVGLTMDLPIIGNFTLPLTKKGELKLPTLSSIF
ncbi:Late embryogenesis abundant protein [Macleaya cordata]|uniref:Late embryogenesis abundant protein n=1 Tax=Macleaya cordata TaxID=56857 RepID=A0A200QCC6_MACCD|nr:Late embryogenesis abundant protein [Macleaya cordata]